METKYSRRSVIAVAGLAIIDTTMTGCAKTPTQPTDDTKAAAGDPKPEPGSAVKTRTASCNCGQLRVTCKGPDPERRSMCHCFVCQKQTGTAFSIQATYPKEQVTIEGKSTAWKFPIEGAKPVTFRNCTRTGVTTYFCPTCGSTVYYVLAETPENIGIRIGCFADPTFPPPIISAFEEYRFPWALNVSALPMPGGHHA